MTKSELKTGMIVVTRNGIQYMVFKDIKTSYTSSVDCMVAIDHELSWELLSTYKEDLTHWRDKCWDIVEVIMVKHPYNLLRPNQKNYTDRTTLWKSKEKKTYTYAQLREILGEEFEVVG